MVNMQKDLIQIWNCNFNLLKKYSIRNLWLEMKYSLIGKCQNKKARFSGLSKCNFKLGFNKLLTSKRIRFEQGNRDYKKIKKNNNIYTIHAPVRKFLILKILQFTISGKIIKWKYLGYMNATTKKKIMQLHAAQHRN